MKRIKDKMMFSVLSVLAVLLVGLTVIISYYIFVSEKESLLDRNLLTAKNYANQIDSFLNRYNSIAQTISDSQETNQNKNRQEVLNFLKQIANRDKNILGSWVIYEPNIFDNQDMRYANSPGHDKTGRFLPYWNRLKGDLILEPVVDVEVSDFYTVPKNSKQVFIPTPYLYEGVLMMSFCYPILKNDKFLGVGGLDISIETLKKLLESFEDNKIYQSNYAVLVSSNGTIISSSNRLFEQAILEKKTLNQVSNQNGISGYETLTKEIQERKEGFLTGEDPFSKEGVVVFYSPTKIGDLSIIVSISKSDLLANTIKAIYILVFIGFVCLIIIGMILYYLINAIIDPLNQLTDTVVEFGKQDFTKRSGVSTNDEIGELAKNFNLMADSIEDYSHKMEEKIQQRTLELNKSLELVTNLKYQQDGDYFLTSILLKPFFKNQAKSSKFKVDFLIEQKKTFEFKQKKLSLGGDLCYTDTIHLREKSFVLFLNGDAMGKSLQGAGGALILGSVFSSIISRYKSNKISQNISPERWLKNVFIELHQTFESFDGLMLVSIVIGLVDEETNVMYYINAEHPFIVLYRDGCAEFIENSLDLRKLGTPMVDGKLFIKTFQLQPNDVILIGSDGKDDLVLSRDPLEVRDINYDETLFLKIVEESLGDISEIRNTLTKYGQLMDDLSLLRIEFSGNYSNYGMDFKEKIKVNTLREAIELLEGMVAKNPLVLKRLTKLYLKTEEFDKAYSSIMAYLSFEQSEVSALFLGCYCSYKVNRYEDAIEFGERCLLREPFNKKYITLVAKIYSFLGNTQRASDLKNRILTLQ